MKKLKIWLGAKDKPLRRVALGAVIALVAAGVIWGGLTLLKTARRQPVNVYPVENFAMTDYWGDSSETYGVVTTDKLQKVYISDSQDIKQVYVQEGQTVRKGDKLLSYDTTLSDLELKRARIAVDEAEVSVTEAQNELKALQLAENKEELEKEKVVLEAELKKAKLDSEYVSGTLPALPYGSWTDAVPRYVEDTGFTIASGSDILDVVKLQALLDESGKDEVYVALVTVDDTGEEVQYTAYRGLHLVSRDGHFGYETAEVDELRSSGGKDTAKVKSLTQQLNRVKVLLTEAYTKEDLIKEINKQKQLVDQKQVDVRLAKLDLKKKQKELGDGAVYSEIDGTVKAVRDPKEAYMAGQAVVEVSGGGGYYITGAISELARDTVTIGQTVTVNSWMNGTVCEGEIVEVGVYPTSANGWGGDGNTNVSWYPLKIFVSEEANLQEGDNVNLTYQAAGQGDSGAWYLESMFIRSEGGRSYVMVRGEDGKLEQRFLQTGRDLWGSYTQITGGDLTTDDFVAFPYGQDTVAGAQTNESTVDEFYMSAI